jgi:hypothetical protein
MNLLPSMPRRYRRMVVRLIVFLALSSPAWGAPQPTPTTSPALAATKPVTICKAQNDPDDDFVARTSGLIGADYACTTVCPDDWRQCFRLTEKAEHHARPLPKVELPFVVDDMAGVLRFTLRTAPTIAVHSGAGGTFYPGEGRWFSGEGEGLIERLEGDGVRVVEVRWILGRPPGIGWLTRKTEEAGSSIHAKAVRPASILKWIRTHLVGGQKFATYGCSGGAVQTLASTMWYEGLDEAIDYQFVSSMPMWDVGKLCTDKAHGVCEHDPARACHPSQPCPGGGRCGYAFTPLLVVRALIDELHGVGVKCTLERYDPAFDASSLARVPATRYAINHPIDFSVNVYATDDPLAGGQDDLTIGAFWHAVHAYRAVRQASPAGRIRLTINERYGHCADGADALVPVTLQKIKAGLQLPSTPPPARFVHGDFCHRFDAATAVPQGFAAPSEEAEAGTHLVVAASCDAKAATVYIGTGSEDQLIYGTAYLGREGESGWRPITLSGQPAKALGDAWRRGQAQAHLTLSPGDLAKNHYILTYVCRWKPAAGLMPGGRWECGCGDAACETPAWRIQAFSGQ